MAQGEARAKMSSVRGFSRTVGIVDFPRESVFRHSRHVVGPHTSEQTKARKKASAKISSVRGYLRTVGNVGIPRMNGVRHSMYLLLRVLLKTLAGRKVKRAPKFHPCGAI